MTSDARPRFRTDLVLRELDDGFVEVEDPRTKRFWRFTELQTDVLSSLDGDTSLALVAEELYGDGVTSALQELVEEARQLGFFEEDAALDVRALAMKQAAAMRERSARLRDQRVSASVRWARDHLRYYEKVLGSAADEIQGVADLIKLPVMTKAEVRANFPEGLIHKDEQLQDLVAAGKALLSSTSGSTGGRLQYVYDLDRTSTRSLLRHPSFAARGPAATFTTPICNGQLCHMGGIPYEERLLTESTLQLNSSERIMRLSKEHCEEILSDCQRHGAKGLIVDPVYGAAMVRAFRSYGLSLPPIDFLSTGWEYLTKRHRVILREAFGHDPEPSYGATDIGGFCAVFCENGRYHGVDHDFVFEFVRDGKPVASGEVGEILITTLRHAYTRHIRYRVGDLGRPVDDCGCSFADWPAFEVEGRVQDVLIGPDGRRITSKMVDDLFEGLNWIDFYQLIQRGPKQFQLMAVKAEEDLDEEAVFVERLQILLGPDTSIRIQYVRELPIEQSMKYPPTKWKCDEPQPAW